MDHIDKVLASASDSPYKFPIAFWAAVVVGKNTMNRSYNKTDQLEVYCIAMGKSSTSYSFMMDYSHLSLFPS
jgi:lipid-A-disaccharide synthase-like uncharacterized protein